MCLTEASSIIVIILIKYGKKLLYSKTGMRCYKWASLIF